MKNLCTLLLVAGCGLSVQAQTPFFKDDFDDNKNNWFVGKVKKSTIEINEGDYRFFDDEGKSPTVSLVDLPFDEHKNYTIEADMTDGYMPWDESRFGVLFAAKDEKNGYGVFFNEHKWIYIVEMSGGKTRELCLNYNSRNSTSVKIILEDWRWKFIVGDTAIFTCDPLPWKGHKAGFLSYQSSFYVHSFSIEEAAPFNACPAPFTLEKFNAQFEKVLCGASHGFNDLINGNALKSGRDSIWVDAVATIDGARSHDIVRSNGSVRQYLISFQCPDSMDFDQAQRLFHDVAHAISAGSYACKKLKPGDVKENVNKNVQMDQQWLSADKSDELPLVELALHNLFKNYEVLIHVYGNW